MTVVWLSHSFEVMIWKNEQQRWIVSSGCNHYHPVAGTWHTWTGDAEVKIVVAWSCFNEKGSRYRKLDSIHANIMILYNMSNMSNIISSCFWSMFLISPCTVHIECHVVIFYFVDCQWKDKIHPAMVQFFLWPTLDVLNWNQSWLSFVQVDDTPNEKRVKQCVGKWNRASADYLWSRWSEHSGKFSHLFLCCRLLIEN